MSSNKENMPPLEPIPMPILNITESDFLDRTENLLGKEMKWEAHMSQQIPSPRSSLPYPVDRLGSLGQLKPETDDDMDIRDFMERLANDKGLPKPKHGPSLMIQNFFPLPQTCSDYIAMTPDTKSTKPPMKEITRDFAQKEKDAPRMASVFKENTPKGWLPG